MAYMPLVLKAIDQGRTGIFWLPKPTLEPKSVVKARDRAGALASDSAISYPELLQRPGRPWRPSCGPEGCWTGSVVSPVSGSHRPCITACLSDQCRNDNYEIS